MNDEQKTKEELLQELAECRLRLGELEILEHDSYRMQEALRQSEERYRAILENIEDGYHEVDLQGRFTFFNAPFQKILGYTKEELQGTSYKNVSDQENAQKVFKAYNQVFRTGRPLKRFVWEIIRKDGVRRQIAVSVSLIRDPSGTPIGFRGIVRDETERQEAEEALRRSEKKYREIFDNALEGIYQATLEGRFLSVNPSLARMLGYGTPEEMTDSIKDIGQDGYVNPQERARLLDILRTKDKVEGFEFESYRKDKSTLWISTNIRLVRNAGGEILYIQGMCIDITQRKQWEEALKKERAKFQLLVEKSPLAIALISREDIYQFINAKFTEIMGYTLEDFSTGREWFKKAFPDPVYRQEAISTWSNDLKEIAIGESPPRTFKVICKDGREKWISFRPVAMEDGSQLVYYEDISEWKQTEDALRSSEKRYRTIFEQSNDGIVIVKGKRHIAANRKMAEMFGYEGPDTIIGQPISFTVHPDDQAKVIDINQRRQKGEAVPLKYEFKGRRKNGQPLFVEVSAAKTDYQGEVAALVFLRDITERKQAEEERRRLEERLQRAEKMEALGTLAGGVAHDLNNVLGVLVGYSELLMLDAPEGSLLKDHALNIHQAGQRATAIIQDLLTLARRGVAISEILNLNQIIREFLETPEFERLKFHHPQTTFKTALAPDLLNIKGSPVHLVKTVMNLLSNGAEAVSGPGEVIIKTENRYIDMPIPGYEETKAGEYVLLIVSDTGVGIPQTDLGRIFEPFYTKKVMGRSGTGLGLAVVWGTVKDHNGYIDVRSMEGQGSTFTLYFPITRETLIEDPDIFSQTEYQGRGESILVVDDVKEQRTLAATMLESLGYKVDTVAGGEEAIEYLKNQPVDLAVLDMIMDPGIDGLETYERILKIRPGQKAIIVSGYSETERVLKAQALGAGDYVRKPYVLKTIGSAVRKELDKKG